jgi:hypothetical protein
MSKLKIVGMMALISFTIGVLLVGHTVAGEKGISAAQTAYYGTTLHTLKVPDMEGHIIFAYEAKGITFHEKWGPCLVNEIGTADLLKGEGTVQGYSHYTFPDGSTNSMKWEGKVRGARAEGTWAYIKGTGKYKGIQGEGTWKSSHMSPEQWHSEDTGEYTLP